MSKKIAPDEVLTLTTDQRAEVEREMCRNSLLYFASNFLGGGAEHDGKFIVGQHHIEWDQLVQKAERICVLAPRDHGKSHFFNLAYPIWRGKYQPRGTQVYLFSANQTLAEEFLQKIVEELTTNPKLADLVPRNWESSWAKRRIRLTTGVEFRARGFGVKVRGGHPKFIVADDMLGDEHIYSETVREKGKDYFLSAITNMVIPGGQLIVVGCVTLDTWISTGKGLKQIGDLCPGEMTPQTMYDLDLPLHGLGGVETATKFWVNGQCPTKKITLERGYRVEGSHRHPLYVMTEAGIPDYKRSDEIQLGDYVAIRPGCEAWGPRVGIGPAALLRGNDFGFPPHMTPDLAYLIGLWTAEGSFEPSGRVMISNTDAEVRDWLLSCPFGMQFKINPSSPWTLRCSAKEFLNLVEKLGGVLGKSDRKTVPGAIIGGDREAARAFLQGLFDGDGCAYVQNRTQQVTLTSTSEELARRTQQLLLNFGVVSSLTRQPKPKPTKKVPHPNHDQWRVRMCAHDAFNFMNTVGFRLSRKQDKLAGMRDLGEISGIPHQAPLIAAARKAKPRAARGRALTPPANVAATAQQERVSKERLGEISRWFRESGATGSAVKSLEDNASSALVWLKVERVDEGEALTADFVVPDGHSFIGNGLVNHNTPMHQADVYAHIAKLKRYACWKEPAVNQKTGKALWPARYDKEALLAKKEEIGSVRFTREFLVEPFSDEMSLFPSHLFEGTPVQQYAIKLGMPAKFWDEMGVTSRFMGVDIAISTTTGADYFVCFVLGRDAMGNRWVCDIVREKGMPFQKQLDTINAVAQKLDPSLIFIESNQMQRVWADELIRTTDLPIKAFITTGTGTMKSKALTQSANKHQLEAGVPSLAPTLENRKWRIPRGDARSIELTDAWMQEMQAMSFIEGKVQSVGEHDDLVLACWIADQALRRGGFSVSFGAEAGAGNFDMESELLTRHKEGEEGAEEGPPPNEIGRPTTADPEGAKGNLGATSPAGDPSATALWSAMPFARGE